MLSFDCRIDALMNKEYFLITSENISAEIAPKMYGYCFYRGELFLEYDEVLGDVVDAAELDGGVCTIIRDNGNRIELIRDRMGLMPIYCYSKDDYWAISNSFFLLFDEAKQKRTLHLDQGYVQAHYTSTWVWMSERTLCKEIKKLSCFNEVCIDKEKNELIIKSNDRLSSRVPLDSKDGIQVLDDWIERWACIIKNMESRYKVSVDLSGGMDSRLGFAFCLAAGLDFNKDNVCLNSTVPKGRLAIFSEDYDIAGRIAENYAIRLGLKQGFNSGDKVVSLQKRYENYRYSVCGNINQAFDRKIYHENSLVRITGFWNEDVRGYRYPLEHYLGQAYLPDVCFGYETVLPNALYSTIDEIKSIRDEIGCDFTDERISLRLTAESLNSRFFAEQAMQYQVMNEIMVSPSMDIAPRLIDCGDEDPSIIEAFVLTRISEILLEFELDHGRKFSDDIKERAKQLCEKYPLDPTRHSYQTEIPKQKFKCIDSDKIIEIQVGDELNTINDIIYAKYNTYKDDKKLEATLGTLHHYIKGKAEQFMSDAGVFHPETFIAALLAIYEVAEASVADVPDESEMIGGEKLIDSALEMYNSSFLWGMKNVYKDYENRIQIIDDIKMNPDKHIYLYGAGKFAASIADELDSMGIKVYGYVVSDINGNNGQGKNILSIDDYMNDDSPKSIYPAVSIRYIDEVKEEIEKLKCEDQI